MKTFLKIAGGIVAAIALLVGAIFYFTGGMASAADEFFIASGKGDTDTAYNYLSEDFKAGTSKGELEEYLAANGLDKAIETSWSSRSINGSTGTLKGTVKTRTGGAIPVELQLVKGDNGWKIYGLQKSRAGFRADDGGAELPDKQEQMRLVHDTMGLFAASVEKQSMDGLYDNISNVWQKQTTPKELDEIFGSFYGQINLTPLQNYTPVITEPATYDAGDTGPITIKGYYPDDNFEITYDFSYIHEGLDWEIFGINVEIKPK